MGAVAKRMGAAATRRMGAAGERGRCAEPAGERGSAGEPAGAGGPRGGGLSLIRGAARHEGAVLLLVALVALAGAAALPSLASSIYPPLQFPRIVMVAHSGILPARSMMLSVTRPLEQAAREVPGIRRVRSKTFRGAAELSALFDPATDMDLALQQLRARVAEARGGMPADLDLQIERLSPATFPMYSLVLTGGLPVADLHDYA